MATRSEMWKVDGQEVRVTSLDKIFWPATGLTKRALLDYYRKVGPILLPYMQERPFTMRAWPDGIEGKNYYRWRLPKHAPDWLERFYYEPRDGGKAIEMAVVDDLPELIWVAQNGVIELHPWFATIHDPDRPSWMVFDLDPVQDVPFDQVLQVAIWIHEMLEETGLEGSPKTTGGDGLHIFVALEPDATFETVREWLGAFIGELTEAHPDEVTSDKSLAERGGKVLIDYSQNARGKSIAAPYSVRAKPGAPVSTPLRWEEVIDGGFLPSSFTLRTLPERLEEVGDLFAGVLEKQQRLPAL